MKSDDYKYYDLDIDDVFLTLNTSESGLSCCDADDRLKSDGKNVIVSLKEVSNVRKFFNQFKDLMIVILIIAAVVSFFLSFSSSESFFDSIIILVIVILNTVLGFLQELKADKSIEALKKMQVSKIKVKRDNKVLVIDSEDLVCGDYIYLEAGDRVPADCRVIFDVSLKVDESSLTGESVSVTKTSDILDDSSVFKGNMVYAGTSVVYGKCHAIVCFTGMDTEFGKIAKGLAETKSEPTPLQRKIDSISKGLSIIIGIVIVVMFIIGLIEGMAISEIVFLSISLAVAAIPEGLPAVITITLSLGMSAMAKKHAIVRKMSSVETLGCAEVICSDKTGTITQNKMVVEEVYFSDCFYNFDGDTDNILLKIMALNNDVEKSDDKYIGEPTEVALYEYSGRYLDIDKFKSYNKRIYEIPFDSERKLMTIVNKDDDKISVYTKGSFDSVIDCCKYIYEDNCVKKLTTSKKNHLRDIERTQASKCYRNLAYAYKVLDEFDECLDFESELIFVGISSMIDPPRSDVKDAISVCKSAGIRPIMITGDSLDTATSIAKEIGILEDGDSAITGSMLDKMDASCLRKNIDKYSVYARVSPMNKLDIVDAWQSKNKVVAMTGDGVNDALALKKADIGIGMGITGTEVSKSASDIILTDDSFSTIVSAIGEGRRIFDNIRNVLVYLLAGNIVEILIVFIGMVLGFEIFVPIQLLYINLITDSIPAIALSFESGDKDIMKRKIRKKDSSFFTGFLIAKMCFSVILKTLSVVLVYYLGLKLYGVSIAKTMSFLVIILLEIVFAFSCKNLKKCVLGGYMFSNSYLNRCVFGLLIVQLIVFATPLRYVFNLEFLSLIQVIYSVVIVICVFLIDELSKVIICRLFKD